MECEVSLDIRHLTFESDIWGGHLIVASMCKRYGQYNIVSWSSSARTCTSFPNVSSNFCVCLFIVLLGRWAIYKACREDNSSPTSAGITCLITSMSLGQCPVHVECEIDWKPLVPQNCEPDSTESFRNLGYPIYVIICGNPQTSFSWDISSLDNCNNFPVMETSVPCILFLANGHTAEVAGLNAIIIVFF